MEEEEDGDTMMHWLCERAVSISSDVTRSCWDWDVGGGDSSFALGSLESSCPSWTSWRALAVWQKVVFLTQCSVWMLFQSISFVCVALLLDTLCTLYSVSDRLRPYSSVVSSFHLMSFVVGCLWSGRCSSRFFWKAKENFKIIFTPFLAWGGGGIGPAGNWNNTSRLPTRVHTLINQNQNLIHEQWTMNRTMNTYIIELTYK